MYEQNDDKSAAEVAKPKKKRMGPILIIVIVSAILVGGGCTFLFFTNSGSDKALKKGEATVKEESAMFSLDPFVVNLSAQGATKFLKVVLQVELSNKAVMETAKAKTPQIRDAIISLLSNHTSDDLMLPEGKLQLKDEISLTMNQILGNNTVKNIYFTDFVMQ